MTHPIQDVFKTSIFTDVSENCMKRQTQIVGCQKRRKKKVIYIAIENGWSNGMHSSDSLVFLPSLFICFAGT